MSEAEDHLLKQVREGDPEGWRQFVLRFERRLTAFAFRETQDHEVAKDLVQETFLAFLKSVHGFRGDGSLESFLFRVLRRRLIDFYRSKGDRRVVSACEIQDSHDLDALFQVASEDISASRHARNEEQQREDRTALKRAIWTLANQLQQAEKFRELKIAEGLFYARLRNAELARLIAVGENEIAVVKHRLIKRLSELTGRERVDSVDQRSGNEAHGDPALDCHDELDFREVWEAQRPSCPKRTTLGKYTLNILPPAWEEFVRFHVETLGCRFCVANLEEIRSPPRTEAKSHTSNDFFQSTIGFLKKRV